MRMATDGGARPFEVGDKCRKYRRPVTKELGRRWIHLDPLRELWGQMQVFDYFQEF